MGAIIDVIREVWVEKEDARIVVRPDVDGLGISVSTEGHQGSLDWFGQFSFTMSKDVAIALSKALADCVREVE